MKNYILTIRIPIVTIDDIEARRIAQKELERISVKGDTAKLQEMIDGKPPRKVNMT